MLHVACLMYCWLNLVVMLEFSVVGLHLVEMVDKLSGTIAVVFFQVVGYLTGR